MFNKSHHLVARPAFALQTLIVIKNRFSPIFCADYKNILYTIKKYSFMTNVALRWLIGEHYVPFCSHICMDVLETAEDFFNVIKFCCLKCFKLRRAIPYYHYPIFLGVYLMLLKKLSNLFKAQFKIFAWDNFSIFTKQHRIIQL